MPKSIVWMTIVCVLLVGCVPANTSHNNNSGKKTKYTNESLLENSGNNQELIKLYKNELKNKEDKKTRLKLVRTYILVKDYESAIFTVTPLLEKSKNAEVYYYYGKAKYGLRMKDEAWDALQKSYALDSKNGKTLNLLGVISCDQGNYYDARVWFLKARSQLFDDVTVKNNLAMLDLIEGKYEAVIEKLSPLVVQPNSSPKVKANLAIAYAKLGRFDEFEQLLKNDRYTDADMKAIYHQLSQVEFKSSEGPVYRPGQ